MDDEIETKLGELRTLRDEWAADQAELGRYATDIGNAFVARFGELDELLTVAADQPVVGHRDGVTWTIHGPVAELELAEPGRRLVLTIEAHRDGETAIALNGQCLGAVQWTG